jgi:hypothetical protein
VPLAFLKQGQARLNELRPKGIAGLHLRRKNGPQRDPSWDVEALDLERAIPTGDLGGSRTEDPKETASFAKLPSRRDIGS